MSAEVPGLPEPSEPSGPSGPSGAQYPDVVLCPGGPLLLRGDHVVQDAEGVAHRTTRPVSAVCRCGKSSTAPWCDGTHKVLPAKLRP